MTARPSQIRPYRILSFLAILHSAVVLGLSFNHDYEWSWWWLGLATSLFLWPLVLALHPGRSILRFLIPTIIAVALFLPCVPTSVSRIRHSVRGWLVANKLEKLLRSNPRMILYSRDADYQQPLEIDRGYRRVGTDEIILPDDLCDNCVESLVRMDDAAIPPRIAACLGHTVNSIIDETDRSDYGRDWQILRKETNGSNEAQAEIKASRDRRHDELDREPYKGPAILGYAEITDHAEQRALITALASSAKRSTGGYLCHNPRHGLYVEDGTTTVTLSICFECQNVYSWGPHYSSIGLDFAITRAPESLFNATLKRHGVPVPQRASP